MAKKYRKKDPHHKREQEKYQHPVPSREFILEYLQELDKPVDFAHLVTAFALKTDEEREGLRRRLIAMRRDGQLFGNRGGCYALVGQLELIRGRVQGHRDGFGFVIPDEGGDDIFLSSWQMKKVFSDDVVLVRTVSVDKRGRKEGNIVEVLQRNTQTIVGRFYRKGACAFVDPDDKSICQDVLVPDKLCQDAEPGQFVVVKITQQPEKRQLPQGEVLEVLGDHATAGMEIELAIRSHQLPYQWPDMLLKQIKSLPDKLRPSDHRDREDLRDLAFVTIDGKDAKDFDDAVYCEKQAEGGWRLWVAIADVAHYVKVDSALDTEAQLRGNSVYFPNKVIPMLPEELSNKLCSLMPKVDRAVMVCEMEINAKGEVQGYEFYEGMIHSHARLTYTQAFEVIEGGDGNLSADIQQRILILHSLYLKLFECRRKRGAIEFDTVETRVVFDKKGKIKRIIPVHRNDAHRLIEEMMLLANMCTAEFLEEEGVPTLYRIHEEPNEDRLTSLRSFLKAMGLRLTGGDKPSARDYNSLLERVADRPDAHLIQTVLLRSMQQAIYYPENCGHFGLHYASYTHFTSPIRRYPDLLVHRALKYLIHLPKTGFTYNKAQMQSLGEHCSITERRADLATRDALDWLKCEYMLDKVGQTLDGIICQVTGFGVFVELQDIYVQGLVHISELPSDFYHFDAVHYVLLGQRSGRSYRLGDALQVVVARVDMDQRRIEFTLTEQAGKTSQAKKNSQQAKKNDKRSKGTKSSRKSKKVWRKK